MFLLDTNIVSEARKRPERQDSAFAAWLGLQDPERHFISAITILEVFEGVARLERRDPRQATALHHWATALEAMFAERVLPVDSTVARRCAQLQVPDPRPDRDALIAATALIHGMTMVTRDVKDFEPMGVPLLNPWEWVQ